MYYTIYKITNKINDKFYIGMHKTNNLDDGYMGSGKLIRRAMEKYGIENFTKEILHIFDNEEDMKNKEKELVVISEDSYNLCDGGHGGFGYINRNKLQPKAGWNHTEEAKRKIARFGNQCFKGKKLSEEHKQKLTFAGKTHSEQTKEKLRELGKLRVGEKSSQYGTCWITNGKENKKIKKENLELWFSKGYSKGRIAGVAQW